MWDFCILSIFNSQGLTGGQGVGFIHLCPCLVGIQQILAERVHEHTDLVWWFHVSIGVAALHRLATAFTTCTLLSSWQQPSQQGLHSALVCPLGN